VWPSLARVEGHYPYLGRVVTWPSDWQPGAIAALEPYIGSEHIVEITLGHRDDVNVVVALLAGYVYEAEDGALTMIYDHSGRPDVYPWPVFSGPVQKMTARLKGRRRKTIFPLP
jgi:hypothetical protein